MLNCSQGIQIALLSFRSGFFVWDDSIEHLYLINFKISNQGFIWDAYCMRVIIYSPIELLYLWLSHDYWVSYLILSVHLLMSDYAVYYIFLLSLGSQLHCFAVKGKGKLTYPWETWTWGRGVHMDGLVTTTVMYTRGTRDLPYTLSCRTTKLYFVIVMAIIFCLKLL